MISVWPAPAKINLFLHVTGRRLDGYHQLQTIFQIVDLADEITLELDSSGEISRNNLLEGVAAETDLTVRAARLLQQNTHTLLGVRIGIRKRIPMGAGLGGGSSDAASVLVALNEIWQTGLSQHELATLGLQLGADVPVFIFGRSAWGEGIGEELQSINLPESWLVIVFPMQSVRTGEIFADRGLTRSTPQTTIDRFLAGESTRNDLQAIVCARYPSVAKALSWLSMFASARMSGSGSSVFASFTSQQQAKKVALQCPQKWQAFVARGIAVSPLHAAILAWREANKGKIK